MRIVTAGDILKVKTGKYDANHATKNGEYEFYTCAIEPLKCDTYSFDDEVLILAGNGANVGEVLYFKGKLEAYQRTYILHKVDANVRYLFFFFKKYWIRQITKRQVGSATNYIKMDDIVSFQIPLPPLPVQERIAAILDAADALRQKDQALLKKYDDLTQSLFLDMFGDPAKNTHSLELTNLESLSIKITDGDHATPKRESSGFKLLSCRNVQNGYLDFRDVDYVGQDEFDRMFKRCNPEKGDILISCSGTIGRTTTIKVDEPFVLVRSAALVKPDHSLINNLYLEYYLRTNYMQAVMYRSANTSSQANLFLKPIKKLPILIPKMDLQEVFSNRVRAIEKQKEQVQVNIKKSEDLFQSLLQKSFKGDAAFRELVRGENLVKETH